MNFAKNLASEQLNKDVMIILDIFLKISCSILHNAFKYGEDRCTQYLGCFRREFGRQLRYVREGRQSEVLDERMRQIFRRGGYPDEFFQAMFADWNVVTDPSKKGG